MPTPSEKDRYERWLALDPQAGTSVSVEVPQPLGCRTLDGTVERNRIRIQDSVFGGTVAIVTIHDSRHATIEYEGGTRRELLKTRRDRFLLCQ